jgi:hypothetical protein
MKGPRPARMPVYGPGFYGPQPPTIPIAPLQVDGAVRPPFLHRERGLVSKARALSHYSGDAF